MSIALLVIGDGRTETHERSWASASENLPPFDHKIVVDDSDHKLGFSGAIQEGWRKVRETECEWVLHVELDFIFSAPIPLDRMIAVLKRRPYLAQLVLKRQPVNDQECAAGGIVEMWPDEYRQVTDNGDVWTEHRLNWSTNPSLYSTGWCAQGWPQVTGSERAFSDRLLEDPELRFAYWGAKYDAPLCEHIGVREGVGY